MAATSTFDWIDTPNPTVRGYTITAKEDIGATIPDFLGATVLWSDCPKWIKQAESVPTSLQGYRLIYSAKAGFQQRRFIFAPNLTREAAQTPYRSYYETEPSMYWPKVFLSLKAYRNIENDKFVIRTRYKDSYQGPTRVLIEEFYSPFPFEIPLYEPMMERGVNEDIGVSIATMSGTYRISFGTFDLDSCLHPLINISVFIDPAITWNSIIYDHASLIEPEPATNYTDWPDELVIDDRQREVLGGWKRRRVTALRPMIVRVTLPTSASITSTGATLGGTVEIQDNAVVTSRGVVYARTSLDANPEVGNSNAASASTTGTTGTFTLAVTGLTPSSNYSFKPWALTSQGVRVYGPVGTFTTSAP